MLTVYKYGFEVPKPPPPPPNPLPWILALGALWWYGSKQGWWKKAGIKLPSLGTGGAGSAGRDSEGGIG